MGRESSASREMLAGGARVRAQPSYFPPAWPWEGAKRETSALAFLPRKTDHIKYHSSGAMRKTGASKVVKNPSKI